MKVQRRAEHRIVETARCGQIRENLSDGEQPGIDLTCR